MVHAREIISIIELIVYIPAIIISIIVCARHGFHRSSGWIYTLLLCGVRIAGAITQILAYHDQSSSLIKTMIILDSIGLSPLLLATLGLLSRFVDFVNAHKPTFFTTKHFQILQLLITVGLILSIAGGTSGSVEPNGTVKVETTSKVGVILYVVALAGISLILFVCSSQESYIPHKERRVPLAIVLALPFVCVRLAYSVLVVALHSDTFNSVDGNVPIWVIMSVIEEFIVVFFYLLLGFGVDKLDPASQGPIASRAWKNKNKGNNRNRHAVRHGKGGRGGIIRNIIQEAQRAREEGAHPPQEMMPADGRYMTPSHSPHHHHQHAHEV